MKIIAKSLLAMAILSGWGTTGFAQETTENRVASNEAWSVFENGDPKDCWGVAIPTETINADEQGRPKAVTRGKILLFVTFHKGQNSVGEVSFTGGYPFRPGSKVTMTVNGTTFELFTEGEYAWSATPEEDAKIIEAMKKGSDAVLKASSARGTFTTDTFSLLGVTAAVDEAAKRCK